MAEDCIFISVLGKCPPKQQLSQSRPDGARLRHIIDASIRYGDSLHIDIQQKLDLDKNLQVYYHKNCISTYLTCAPASTPSHEMVPFLNVPEAQTFLPSTSENIAYIVAKGA